MASGRCPPPTLAPICGRVIVRPCWPHKLENVEVFPDTLMNPVYQCEVRILRIAECICTAPIECGARAVKLGFNKLHTDRNRIVDEDADVMFLCLIIPCGASNVAQLLHRVWFAQLIEPMG